MLAGDYYITAIKPPEKERPIGKWGRMHRAYLHLSCRPERTGAGPLPAHHPADDRGRGCDREHEAAAADGVGAVAVKPEVAKVLTELANRLILSAFGNENAMNTIRRLLIAEKVMVDPAIRQTVHELVSDIAVMAVCVPQKYEAYLADSQSIDAAYTMDDDEAVIRQK